MSQKIFLGTAGTAKRSNDLSADDISTDDEGARAMAKILKYATFDLTREQGQSWMLAFQGLHARQFIGTQDTFSLRSSRRRLLVHLTDCHDTFFPLRISGG
jgi:hypothetical protein